MPEPLVVEQLQLLVKAETTKGTAESLTSTDGAIRISAATNPDTQQEMTPREVARSNITKLASLPGQKSINFTVRSEANTADTITDDFEQIELLKGCLCRVDDASRIAVGSYTGTFLVGESVSDGTDTGVVIKPARDGDSYLHYVADGDELSTGLTITGATSGATCASTGDGELYGQAIRPRTDGSETVTMRLENDGYQWTGKGCMGTGTLTAESSKPAYWDLTYSGVKSSYGDQAMTTGITYPTEVPPTLENAGLLIGAYTPVFNSIGLDLGNNVVPRPDGNADDTGIISFYIPSREPKATISMEMPLATDYDLQTDFAAGTTKQLEYAIGDTAGKQLYITCPYAQINSVSVGDQDGRRSVDIEYMLTGAANGANDEWVIAVI